MVIIFVFVLGYQPSAQAQSIGIKISPVKIAEYVDPGQVLDGTVSVTNVSNEAKTLYPYLRDFKAEGESGNPKLIVPGTERGYFLASWINIATDGIDFAPNEQKEIPYSITVPTDAGPGGYYGAIIFGTKAPKLKQESEDKGAGMAIAQQTGSLILLQVRGDVNETANFREFSTDKDVYGTPYSVNFTVRVENKGNVHIMPHGAITITNMFGKEVGIVRVNDGGSYVLPDSIRRFDIVWDGSQGFGKYTASCGLTFGTPPSEGGQGKQTLYTETTFWIIPWKIVIPASISLVIFLTLLILFLRFYKSKAVKRALQQFGLGQVRYVRRYQGPSPVWHFGLIISALLVIAFLVGVVSYFIFLA